MGFLIVALKQNSAFSEKRLISKYIIYYIYIYIYGSLYDTAYVWRSKGTLWELVFCVHWVDLGDEPGLSGVVLASLHNEPSF